MSDYGLFNFNDAPADNETRERVPYVSIVTGTSANSGKFSFNSPIENGEISVSGQPELRAVALHFIPVALPQAAREYSVQTEQEGKVAETLCRSNDNIVPVGNGQEFVDARVPNGKIRVNKSLAPNQVALRGDVVEVGGCAACPASQWGKQLKLETNDPPPCQQTGLFLIYALQGLIVNPQNHPGDSPMAFYRANGNTDNFREIPWDETAMFVLRSYSRDSIMKGSYKTPDKKDHPTISAKDALRSYMPSKVANEELAEYLKQFTGAPEHLLAFDVNGEIMGVKQVELQNEIPEFLGLFTLTLTTETFRNNRNTQSFAAVIKLPTSDSPILHKDTPQYEKYMDLRFKTTQMSLPEIAGFTSSPTRIEIIEVPSLVSGAIVPPTMTDTDDPYGIEDSFLNDL